MDKETLKKNVDAYAETFDQIAMETSPQSALASMMSAAAIYLGKLSVSEEGINALIAGQKQIALDVYNEVNKEQITQTFAELKKAAVDGSLLDLLKQKDKDEMD